MNDTTAADQGGRVIPRCLHCNLAMTPHPSGNFYECPNWFTPQRCNYVYRAPPLEVRINTRDERGQVQPIDAKTAEAVTALLRATYDRLCVVPAPATEPAPRDAAKAETPDTIRIVKCPADGCGGEMLEWRHPHFPGDELCLRCMSCGLRRPLNRTRDAAPPPVPPAPQPGPYAHLSGAEMNDGIGATVGVPPPAPQPAQAETYGQREAHNLFGINCADGDLFVWFAFPGGRVYWKLGQTVKAEDHYHIETGIAAALDAARADAWERAAKVAEGKGNHHIASEIRAAGAAEGAGG